jgi:hypothetical protein
MYCSSFDLANKNSDQLCLIVLTPDLLLAVKRRLWVLQRAAIFSVLARFFYVKPKQLWQEPQLKLQPQLSHAIAHDQASQKQQQVGQSLK